MKVPEELRARIAGLDLGQPEPEPRKVQERKQKPIEPAPTPAMIQVSPLSATTTPRYIAPSGDLDNVKLIVGGREVVITSVDWEMGYDAQGIRVTVQGVIA